MNTKCVFLIMIISVLHEAPTLISKRRVRYYHFYLKPTVVFYCIWDQIPNPYHKVWVTPHSVLQKLYHVIINPYLPPKPSLHPSIFTRLLPLPLECFPTLLLDVLLSPGRGVSSCGNLCDPPDQERGPVTQCQ